MTGQSDSGFEGLGDLWEDGFFDPPPESRPKRPSLFDLLTVLLSSSTRYVDHTFRSYCRELLYSNSYDFGEDPLTHIRLLGLSINELRSVERPSVHAGSASAFSNSPIHYPHSLDAAKTLLDDLAKSGCYLLLCAASDDPSLPDPLRSSACALRLKAAESLLRRMPIEDDLFDELIFLSSGGHFLSPGVNIFPNLPVSIMPSKKTTDIKLAHHARYIVLAAQVQLNDMARHIVTSVLVPFLNEAAQERPLPSPPKEKAAQPQVLPNTTLGFLAYHLANQKAARERSQSESAAKLASNNPSMSKKHGSKVIVTEKHLTIVALSGLSVLGPQTFSKTPVPAESVAPATNSLRSLFDHYLAKQRSAREKSDRERSEKSAAETLLFSASASARPLELGPAALKCLADFVKNPIPSTCAKNPKPLSSMGITLSCEFERRSGISMPERMLAVRLLADGKFSLSSDGLTASKYLYSVSKLSWISKSDRYSLICRSEKLFLEYLDAPSSHVPFESVSRISSDASVPAHLRVLALSRLDSTAQEAISNLSRVLCKPLSNEFEQRKKEAGLVRDVLSVVLDARVSADLRKKAKASLGPLVPKLSMSYGLPAGSEIFLRFRETDRPGSVSGTHDVVPPGRLRHL